MNKKCNRICNLSPPVGWWFRLPFTPWGLGLGTPDPTLEGREEGRPDKKLPLGEMQGAGLPDKTLPGRERARAPGTLTVYADVYESRKDS